MAISISSSIQIRNGLLRKMSQSRLVLAFWFISFSDLGVQKWDTVQDKMELEDAVSPNVLQVLLGVWSVVLAER